MADVEIATVLPKEIRLGVPPKMPQARTYLFRQQSSLANYSYGNTIQINIPRLQRSYLRKDSYLRFRLNGFFNNPNVGCSLALDTAGAFGLFEKLEVFDYLGSTVLESISGVPQLMSLLLDLGLKEIVHRNNGTELAGLIGDYCVNGDVPFSFATGTANATTTTGTIYQTGLVSPPSSGCILEPGTYATVDDTVTIGNIVTANTFPQPTGRTLGNGTTIIFATAPTGVTAGTTYYVINSKEDSFQIAATADGGVVPFVVPGTPTTYNVTLTAGGITSFSKEFAIPLPSFLGFLSNKMIPLHNGFTIVLTVASQKKPMFLSQPMDPIVNITTAGVVSGNTRTATSFGITEAANTVVWNLTDVYMECQILELGPVAESMILSSTQGAPLVVHTKSFRNYSNTVKGATWSGTTLVSTGTQEFNLPLNLNVASLTNILWFMRPTDHADSFLYPSCGERTRNMLQRWQFQYGSTTLPQNNGIFAMAQTLPNYPGYSGSPLPTAFTRYRDYAFGSTECFQELMKCRPVNLTTSTFTFDGYNVDSIFNTNLDPKSTGTELGNVVLGLNWKNVFPAVRSWIPLPRFACGLNLQLASGKDGEIISGLNTNGMNTSIRGNFHPLYTDNMANVIVDAFAEYDSFINISPGIATTVSF